MFYNETLTIINIQLHQAKMFNIILLIVSSVYIKLVGDLKSVSHDVQFDWFCRQCVQLTLFEKQMMPKKCICQLFLLTILYEGLHVIPTVRLFAYNNLHKKSFFFLFRILLVTVKRKCVFFKICVDNVDVDVGVLNYLGFRMRTLSIFCFY